MSRQVILDLLPPEVVARLCLTSSSFRAICSTYLQDRIRRDVRKKDITLDPSNPVSSYVDILTDETKFVMKGSEYFTTLGEALFRALLLDDEELIDYFYSRFPRTSTADDIIYLFSVIGKNNVKSIPPRLRALGRYLLGPPERRGIILDYHFRGFVRLRSSSLLDEVLKRFEPSQDTLDEALRKSARGGDLFMVRYLIEKGAKNLNEALTFSVYKNRLDVVKYLVERGADPDFGLWGAAAGGKLDIVRYLVEKGARDIDNSIYAAKHKGYTKIVEYLEGVKQSM